MAPSRWGRMRFGPSGSLDKTFISEGISEVDKMSWTCIYCGASYPPHADSCPSCDARFDSYVYFLVNYPWIETQLRYGSLLGIVWASLVVPFLMGIVMGHPYIGVAVAAIAGLVLIFSWDALTRVLGVGRYRRLPRAPRPSPRGGAETKK